MFRDLEAAATAVRDWIIYPESDEIKDDDAVKIWKILGKRFTNIVHLKNDGDISGASLCGINTSRFTIAVTCPFCLALHKAELARSDQTSDYYQWDTQFNP